MIVLATLAAVIASQAVITGAFSVTRQAIQLGYLPRLQIKLHLQATPSARSTCPRSTGCCWSAVIVLVLVFRSSSSAGHRLRPVGHRHHADRHAAAGGGGLHALAGFARRWVLPLCALFLVIDLAFLIANGAKLFTGIGAWVPLFLGIVAFTMMRTWRRGRELLHAEVQQGRHPAGQPSCPA